jgi:hypothetical protein
MGAPLVTVQVSGNTGGSIVVSPSAVDFGVVPVGASRVRTVFIRTRADRPVAVQRIGTSCEAIKVTAHAELSKFTDCGVVAEKITRVDFELSPTRDLVGDVAATWLATNAPGYENVKLPIRAHVCASFIAVPSVVALPQVAETEQYAAEVCLTSVLGAAFTARLIDTHGLEGEVAVKANGQTNVAVIKLRGSGRDFLRVNGERLTVGIGATPNSKEMLVDIPIFAAPRMR